MTLYLAFNEAEGVETTNIEGRTEVVSDITAACRYGFQIPNIGGGASMASNYTFDSIQFTSISEAWIRTRIRGGDPDTGISPDSVDHPVFEIKDTSGNSLVQIQLNNDNSSTWIWYIQTANGTQTQIEASAQRITVDLNVKISDDPLLGFVTCYVNESKVYEETGATNAASGVTQFNKLTFHHARQTQVGAAPAAGGTQFAQVIVDSDSTIGSTLYTLHPTANGGLNDWDDADYTYIDEVGIDTTDVAITSTNGDEFTWDNSTVTLPTLSSPEVYSHVISSFKAGYDSGSAVTKMSHVLNDTTATATYYGTSETLSTSFAGYQNIWATDPADSQQWTKAKIDDYEFGVRADT